MVGFRYFFSTYFTYKSKPYLSDGQPKYKNGAAGASGPASGAAGPASGAAGPASGAADLPPVLPALLPVRTVTGRGFARGPRGIRRELVVKLKVKKFIFMQFSLNNKRRDTLNNRIQVIIFTAYRTYLLYFSIYM